MYSRPVYIHVLDIAPYRVFCFIHPLQAAAMPCTCKDPIRLSYERWTHYEAIVPTRQINSSRKVPGFYEMHALMPRALIKIPSLLVDREPDIENLERLLYEQYSKMISR